MLKVHNSFHARLRWVTDSDWYRFLAARPQLSEVNFWRPSGGRAFHSLATGETFFLRLITRITGFGDPRLSPQRLGQRSFQAVVLAAYYRRCAVTGTKISPILQAAHIRPVTAGLGTGDARRPSAASVPS